MTGTDLTNVRSKIILLFASDDKELKKLGQKLCHAYRISYHIVKFNAGRWKILRDYTWFFLDNIREISDIHNDLMMKTMVIYKIELKERK